MKKVYLMGLALVTLFNTTAQDCTGGRYDQETFADFDLTADIVYGNNDRNNGDNIDLLLDVYEPTGDTETNRPLIIFMHGGTFIAGSKEGGDVKPLAEDFCRKGYVTSSINYRLGIDNIADFIGGGPDDKDLSEAVMRATQDARAAVRFFRKSVDEDGNPYGIDPDHIYLVGSSAGGFMAVHLAYLTDDNDIPSVIDQTNVGLGGGTEGLSGNAGYSSEVTAIVNIAGALGDADWIDDTKAPVLSLHGDDDGTVPYGTALIGAGIYEDIILVDGSESIHKKAEEVGLKHCFKPFYGQGHVPHTDDADYYDTTSMYINQWLLSFVCNDTEYCLCETTQDETDCYDYGSLSVLNESFNAESLKVYPNPATSSFTIESLDNIREFAVIGMNGQIIERGNGNQQNFIDINSDKYLPGMYIVRITTENGIATEKIIIE